MVKRPEDVSTGMGNETFRQEYRYIPPQEVAQALERFGYGPEKRFVDALYIRGNEKEGIGVLEVTEAHCKDHFVGDPILRGVDQIEAAAQTLLLLGVFTTGIPEGYGPLFSSLGQTEFKNPVVPGSVLNIHVEQEESQSNNVFWGKARIVSGEAEIVRIDELYGAIMPIALRDRLLARSVRSQQRTPSRFQVLK
jgi:3-hydroxyacyl-[acyl-carrier-protein] dehydratase